MDKNSKDIKENFFNKVETTDTLAKILNNYSIEQIREAFEIVEKQRS